MDLFAGLIITLTVTLVLVLLAFIFKPPKKPKAEKRLSVPKIEKRKRVETPKFKVAPNGGIYIPKEVPRTLDTLKVITEESPDLVVGVVKGWLREKR